MRHYSEQELVLYYYGEGRRRATVERHLADCAACRSSFHEITGTLALLTAPEIPERGDQYGLEVWQRIRHQLPERETSWLGAWHWTAAIQDWALGTGAPGTGRWLNRLAIAGAVAVLLVAAFVTGRVWPPPATPASTSVAPSSPLATDAGTRERILLTSVADHLERSERMLTDIMNAPDRSDISGEQEQASDLLSASRLYRQDALDAGEQSVAMVLDELERNLIEIVHSPSQISAADLEQIRRRIDAAALLFKVRVLSDELRQRDDVARPPAVVTQTGKTS